MLVREENLWLLEIFDQVKAIQKDLAPYMINDPHRHLAIVDYYLGLILYNLHEYNDDLEAEAVMGMD